jgi:hypothetical protein
VQHQVYLRTFIPRSDGSVEELVDRAPGRPAEGGGARGWRGRAARGDQGGGAGMAEAELQPTGDG